MFSFDDVIMVNTALQSSLVVARPFPQVLSIESSHLTDVGKILWFFREADVAIRRFHIEVCVYREYNYMI